MRALVVALALATSVGGDVAGTSRSADRQWRTGRWRTPSDTLGSVAPARGAPSYAIDSDGSRRHEVEDIVPLGGRPLAVTLGTPIKYVVETFIVHVLARRGIERTLRLVTTTATTPSQTAGGKDEPAYPAIGAGHYIKSVQEEGRFITLEDKSVWEIEPAGRYLTVQWEVLAGISIRRSGGDDGFVYEIANLDRDEGASARWVRP
jgi:hypothetical protein